MWRRQAWLAPLSLALMPWLVFLPTTLMRAVFFFGDVYAYFYPYHVLPAALLKRGELPLWNPFAFSGMPLLADGQTALFHPVSWLFFVLPAGMALNDAILLQFSFAGAGTYALLRVLGLQRLPAFVGGVVYMFCGGMTARVVHLSILGGAALMPLALCCIELAFREPRPLAVLPAGEARTNPAPRAGKRAPAPWLVAAAGVIALQVFAGHPQIPVYTAMMIGLYAFVRGVERWRASGRRGSLLRLPAIVAGSYLLGGALAAIQLVPWAEAGAMSTRAAGASFDMVFNTSMARSEWLLQLFPYLFGSLRPGLFGEPPSSLLQTVRYIEHSAYTGILPLGLAACAFLGLRESRAAGPAGRPAFYSVLFFSLLALLGLLLAIGWGTPMAHLVYRTPVLGRLRAVERALVMVDLAVAGLAAFGMQRLMTAAQASASRDCTGVEARARTVPAAGSGLGTQVAKPVLVTIGAATAAIPVAVLLLVTRPWFQRLMNLPHEATASLQLPRPNALLPVLLAFASAALLFWWSRRSPTRVTLALATGLIVLDLGGYAALFNPTADPGFYGRRPQVLAALPDGPGHARKATFLPRVSPLNRTLHESLPMSWGMVYGVEDVNGCNSLQTRRYTDYLFGPDEGDVSYGLLRDERLLRPESPVLSSLNVRYLLVPAGTAARVGGHYRRSWQSPDVTVYENTLAYPRAFFTRAVHGMTDAGEVRRIVTADGFDGRRLALVETEAPPVLPVPAGEDTVTSTAWSVNRISFACTTATPRFLVLSEMYSPGWEATVDDVPTPIYRTNYLFRGVVVPAGQHAVTFTYRPRSVLLGAAVSGVALVAALAILAAVWRRRQKIV